MIHPMQKLVKTEGDTLRFQENKIVTYLLDRGPFDMNTIRYLGFSNEDLEQFAQLIGYSATGFCDLSYVSYEAKIHVEKEWIEAYK